MADYGSPFIRLTAIGMIYAIERFAWTLSINPSGPTVLQPSDADAAAARAAVQTFHARTGFISPACGLLGVKLARLGADGLYTDDAATESFFATPSGQPGTGTGNPAPQVALAVTLLGAKPRSAAGRGRFYVPMPTAPLQQDGRLTPAQVLETANAAAVMINALNAALPGRVAIVGAATETGRGPARQNVVAVRVGRVYDTIRSRRTSLPEEPVSATTVVTNPT